MIENLDELAKQVGGPFRLCTLLIKRAREVMHGAPKLVPVDSSDPIEIALAEVRAGKLLLIEEGDEVEEEGTKKKGK